MKRVLLIDDSQVTRQVMRFALERDGYTVDEADDGMHALQLLDTLKVHVIVCDMAMPRMGGLDFLKNLRSKTEHRFTPVVMLTTESRIERKQEARTLGAQAWATKPCPPSQLVDIVKRLTG